MYVFDVMIKEEAPDEEQINTEEYSPQSLKALSSMKCQQIMRVLRDPHQWVEYSEMVKKHQVVKQGISGQFHEQFNLTSLPTISEIKSELTWELDADPIRLQHEPNELCGRNQVQTESFSGTDEMKLDSAVIVNNDQLVKVDEIIHIANDHTYVDAQADTKYGYTVEQLNPDDTIPEEPPQELVADCRVLLIKHMPPVWHINKIRQFIIENTSATQEDIIDIFIYSTEKDINRGQFLFEFRSPKVCHQVFKEFMQFAKEKLYTMRAEFDIGHQKLNYKLKEIQLRPISELHTRRRVTLTQQETLWQFLIKNKAIATGYNKSTQAREYAKRMWIKIQEALNSHEDGAVKDWRGWCKYWVDYKSKLKKLAANAKATQRRTGGDPLELKELTEMEKKFLRILDKNYNASLAGRRVEPFREILPMEVDEPINSASISAEYKSLPLPLPQLQLTPATALTSTATLPSPVATPPPPAAIPPRPVTPPPFTSHPTPVPPPPATTPPPSTSHSTPAPPPVSPPGQQNTPPPTSRRRRSRREPAMSQEAARRALIEISKERAQIESRNSELLRCLLEEIKEIKNILRSNKSGQIHQQVNNDTYGLSLSYLENLGIQPPLSPTVFVSQLSMYVDDELVRQIFSIAGQIKFFSFRVISLADITAEIEYDHPVEAVQAVAMFDKQKIYDRVISVKLVQRSAHVFKLPRGLEAVGPGLGPNGAPLRGVRAMMELQPVKDILHDIKFALRNVHMASDNSHFDKLVQIRKEADIVAPSTDDYSNTEQQNTHSNSFTHSTIVNIEQQNTLSTSTSNIEQQNAHSSSIANTEQQNAHSSIIANTEQQNTPSTSTANIELQNTLLTSNAIAHPSVLLELANTLKELINALQKNNLVNTNVTPNITQENATQKRPSSNLIQSQNENSQNANSGPEPAKKPKGKLGQQLPDYSSTISIQHPSTSRQACRSQDCNPNVARYNFQHQRNLAQHIILPNTNAPFIPNGHNVVRFDMIGSILNSNQFEFNMDHNARSNVHNVSPHVPYISRNIPDASQNPATSQPNVAQNMPNMSQNSPVHRTSSLSDNVNQKNSNTPDERLNTNIDQNAPVRSSKSPMEIVHSNVNQNPSANQNMNQIPPNINQNIHKSTPNTNPSDVNQIKTENASNVYPNLHTSDTNKNNICSRNYLSLGPSTSQTAQNILGSDQNPAMPTSPPTPPPPQITNSSSISKSVGDSDARHRQVDVNKLDTVIFNDLPDGVTVKILNSKMLEVGKVQCVENISKGCFMVKFMYHRDAERCVKLFHRSKVDGKVIDVKYFQF